MKNNKVTRFLALLLGMSMTVSLAACGSGEKEVAKESSTQKESSVSQGSSEVQTTEEEPEEPVTLTVAVYDRGTMPAEYGTPTDNKWVKLHQEMVLEALNIDLQYVAIPKSGDTAKLQALIAAGNEPDIFYTYSQSKFSEWAEAGYLADLTPYMDTAAGQEIANALNETIMENGKFEGVQYSVPCPRYEVAKTGSLIRKDWLDAVGVKLEEVNGHYAIRPSALMDAMIKIKEAGLCDYPIGMYSGDKALRAAVGAFVTDVTDEVLVQGLEQTEGYKEAMRFLNECYNEGLINPDFPLHDINNLYEVISTGRVAFWTQDAWLSMPERGILYETDPSAEYVAVELVHEDGTPANYEMYAPVGAYGIVSSNCENVEKAVELISWFLSDEAHIVGYHGIEGEHWEYDADGDIVEIDPEYNATDRNRVTDLNVYLNNDPCRNNPDVEVVKNIWAKANYSLFTKQAVDQTVINMFDIAIGEGKYYPPVINALIQASIDYSAELSENKTNLTIGSITASADKFDQVYDEYLEIYMKEGGSQVAEEKLEVWNKTN